MYDHKMLQLGFMATMTFSEQIGINSYMAFECIWHIL